MYNTYEYTGPVVEFGRCIADNWRASTKAPSEAKARNNLMYQFKTKNNRLASAKIVLPGKLKVVD